MITWRFYNNESLVNCFVTFSAFSSAGELYDTDLYDLWVDITQGEVEHPSQVIATNFDSQYIHTDLHHDDFLQVAVEDPGLKEVYRDDQAVIFEVITQ